MIPSNTDWAEAPDEPVVRTGRVDRIPHKMKYEMLKKAADEGGFVIVSELNWLSPDERDVLTFLAVKDEGWQGQPLWAGVKGSHRKGSGVGMRWYHGVAAPGGGGVCLARSPETRRQTSVENVADFMTECFDVLAVNQTAYRAQVTRLRSMKMTERTWHEYMMTRARSHRRDHDRVTWPVLGRVDKMFKDTNAKTAWDLIVCFSQTMLTYGTYTHHKIDQLYAFGKELVEKARDAVDD